MIFNRNFTQLKDILFLTSGYHRKALCVQISNNYSHYRQYQYEFNCWPLKKRVRKSLKMPKSQIFGQFPPNENILFAKIPSFVIFVINHQKSNSQLNFYFFNFTYESLCSLFFFICLGHRFFKIIARGLGICGTNQKQRIFISDDNMLVLSSL